MEQFLQVRKALVDFFQHSLSSGMKPDFLSFRGSNAIEDKDGMALVDPVDVIWETVFENLSGLKFFPS